MAGRFPNRAAQQRITCRKRARRPLAMHPNVSEVRVPLLLHQVVTDLVNQFEIGVESFAERFSYLFENDQTVENRIVAAGRNCVQIIPIMF